MIQTFYTPTMEERKRAKEKEERQQSAKSTKRGGAGTQPPAEGKTTGLQKPGELRPTSSASKKTSSTSVIGKGKKK